MRLAAGTCLGTFQVLAPIGSGGMGEVYRARDTRLKREVAVKVLSNGWTSADRVARFQREAQLLAALTHPNIAVIYGVEEVEGITALVLELVEGPTLADRLAHGPMPLPEALAVARQIIDALDAAHEKGIVHRDLKPANIKVREDGAVKVLDFGLAKMLEPEAAPTVDATVSPTMTSPVVTGMGALLGTATYMSPEQARGQTIDKRTDIWAFGCVLYELLTARSAFAGATIADTLAAVVGREPDWSALPPETPTSVRQLLRRCLEKDRKRRLRDIGDAILELEAREETTTMQRGNRRAVAAAVAAALMAAIIAFAFSARRVGGSMPSSVILELAAEVTQNLAMSADGKTIAWVAPRDGVSRIWLRRLDAIDTRELPGTEGATQPFLAPDGRAVAYFDNGLLKRFDIATGAIQTLTASAVVSPGGAWGSRDIILFSNRYGLQQVPAGGGSPQTVIPLNAQFHENSLRWPQFLPDGQHFVYVARSGRPDESGAYLASLDGTSRRLFSTTSKIMFAPADRLLYVKDGLLQTQRLDVTTARVEGAPVTLATDVFSVTTGLVAAFAVSETGVLLYARARPQSTATLRWIDRSGRDLGAFTAHVQTNQFRISPDGQRVAAAVPDPSSGGRSVWIYESERSPVRFTFAETHDWEPIWSPDGRRIVFGSYRNGPLDLFMKDSDGRSVEVPLVLSRNQKDTSDWSPDGKYVLYRDSRDDASGDLVAVEAADPSQRVLITTTAADERIARWSGDGKWIAYSSGDGKGTEVFVQPFPPTGAKWQVSVGGGDEPTWRRDGRELYYIDPHGMLIAVSVDSSGGSFAPSGARPLFKVGPALGSSFGQRYDVAPDGSKFLVSVDDPRPPAKPPVLMLNWQSALTGK